MYFDIILTFLFILIPELSLNNIDFESKLLRILRERVTQLRQMSPLIL